MFDLTKIPDCGPYSMNHYEKLVLYTEALNALTLYHYANCREYRRILQLFGFDTRINHPIESIPFIPVRLFKEYQLLSVDKSEVIKTMTSSGTTGQRVSQIFLDRDTATDQTKVLTKIVSSLLGPKRLPMLVIDSRAVVKDRRLFSARGAGILGFSMLGYDVTYALNANMELDFTAIDAFLAKHRGENLLLFGFTYMIWQHFYKRLTETGKKLDLKDAVLIHGGGWKKLQQDAVDNQTFKQLLTKACGIEKIHNYYGMVEQTGSIFLECEAGHLHASVFSDVLIRDHKNFSCLGTKQKGLVQLISLLPRSYPGHSILSEDVGEILGEDDCACGRKGKYFRIYGRIENAELRGCSDTYAS